MQLVATDLETDRKQVAAIGVFSNDGKILMGRRRDNNRWTNPGGHIDPGERITDGAFRELREETGIEAHGLLHLGSEPVTTFTGKKLIIHAFHCTVSDRANVTTELDPDHEVFKWEWIDCTMGLPDEVLLNLHSPENLILKKMGLLREVQPVEFEFVIKAEKGSVKAGHKYIRRYMRNGRWVYIYHEGQNRPREIKEAAISKIKELASLGHKRSRKLVDSIQDHNPDKLQKLHELHKLGHEPATRHLHSLGIDPDKIPLHEQILGGLSAVKEMDEGDARVWHEAIRRGLEPQFSHLQTHSTSSPATALRDSGISLESVMEKISKERSPAGILQTLHDQMSGIDRAHEGVVSQHAPANSAGGYGNLGHNRSLDELVRQNLIPGSHNIARGDIDQSSLSETLDKHAEERVRAQQEARERAEREAQERADRERRELEARERAERELAGSMAAYVRELAGNAITPRQTMDIQEWFNRAFGNRPDGQTLRAEDFPYAWDEHDVKVKVRSVRIEGDSIYWELSAWKGGHQITNGWTRKWTIKSNGGVEIYNAYLTVHQNMRNTVKIGELINSSQVEFLKKFSPTGSIRVNADIDVGGYNWANQGFSFESESTLRSMRAGFRNFCLRNGVRLTDDDLQKFTLPCHFSSFHVPGVTPGGKHLGKKFLLNQSWYGIIRIDNANETNPAYRFLKNYRTMRRETWKKLEPEFVRMVEAVRGARGSGEERSSAPSQSAGIRLPRGYASWSAERIRNFYDANRTHMNPGQRRRINTAYVDAMARERRSA